MKAALLLSGGMDSICVAWWKRPSLAITVDYGQLASEAELAASMAVCLQLGIEHHVVRVNCRALGSGDMAGAATDSHAPASDWWPYRNQLLVTIAATKVIGLGVDTLYLGTVRSDGAHRDGTQAFVETMSELLALQEGAMRVEAPAIAMSTTELVLRCGIPHELLAWAHSCHKANVACANCRGCNKYFEVLRELSDGVDQSRQPSTLA